MRVVSEVADCLLTEHSSSLLSVVWKHSSGSSTQMRAESYSVTIMYAILNATNSAFSDPQQQAFPVVFGRLYLALLSFP